MAHSKLKGRSIKFNIDILGKKDENESYSSKKGTELPLLQADSPANWKAKVEIGEDTEQEMSSWEAADKRAFRLGARKFYIKCTEYLVSRLPFGNLLLKSLRFLKPESVEKESSSSDLRQLASGLPQVIQPRDISALMDEYNLLRLQHIESNASTSVEKYWQNIFDKKKPDNGANSFAVDTVIAIASVISAESRESCRAVPPNILQSSADEKNPSLAKLWYLLKRNATNKQTTTLGLSFEMGTLMYELTSDHNDLASAVNAKCNGTSLTSREALCGAAKVVDTAKQKLAAPYLTYGGFPTAGNNRRVVFTDYLHTATERFLNVSGGTGSNDLRSRVAWMLFNVHLADTGKICGGIPPFELENDFCKVFLPSGQGC
ncbi:uncharacterized protein [Dermacentor andersoni]|uniref:uncharacterized protein n=1 Tax=Dermacentor andersoni TaxID=34620 RepID=UPI0024176802|nr:uncharacterized protein LOC126533694 [Dermacentor andersoni]